MIGQTISHYRILQKSAEGGMGVVYRAFDDQLEREVALKVLPIESLSDPIARARLRREAQTAAVLVVPQSGGRDDVAGMCPPCEWPLPYGGDYRHHRQCSSGAVRYRNRSQIVAGWRAVWHQDVYPHALRIARCRRDREHVRWLMIPRINIWPETVRIISGHRT